MSVEQAWTVLEGLCCDMQEGATLSDRGWAKLAECRRVLQFEGKHGEAKQ